MDVAAAQALARTIRRRLVLGRDTAEDVLRRRGERLEAEARMRREIDRAVRLWGRTNRFVR